MNIMHIIVGLAVGIAIGAMDFSLARSIATMIRTAKVRTVQVIMVSGFMFRIVAIGIVLWVVSHADKSIFMAVCVGLLVTFTILTLGHAIRSFTGTVRIQKQMSDRR